MGDSDDGHRGPGETVPHPRTLAARIRAASGCPSRARHHTLLERVRYIAIVSELIDEIYQVRVAGLDERLEAGFEDLQKRGIGPGELLHRIRKNVSEICEHQSGVFRAESFRRSNGGGIRILLWEDLGNEDRRHLTEVFHEQVYPVLTPLAVDPGTSVPLHLQPFR